MQSKHLPGVEIDPGKMYALDIELKRKGDIKRFRELVAERGGRISDEYMEHSTILFRVHIQGQHIDWLASSVDMAVSLPPVPQLGVEREDDEFGSTWSTSDKSRVRPEALKGVEEIYLQHPDSWGNWLWVRKDNLGNYEIAIKYEGDSEMHEFKLSLENVGIIRGAISNIEKRLQRELQEKQNRADGRA